MTDFTPIKNIIFDLGDVIINIDFSLTYRELAKLTHKNPDEVKKKLDAMDVWNRYEEGLLSDTAFLDILYKELDLQCTKEELVAAWCGLLLDIPQRRIALLDRLREKYKLYILSNTSFFHIDAINKMLKSNFSRDGLASLVNKAYYSYEMKMRKPNKEIYLTLMADAGIRSGETLFLDDNVDNIAIAAKLGMHTILVDRYASCITEYLENA